ncbi:hypothetical protein Tco_0657552 [Tanacetum coccineum]
MIGRVYGQDQKERGQPGRPRILWKGIPLRKESHGLYWLILNKPELLISSFELFYLCLAKVTSELFLRETLGKFLIALFGIILSYIFACIKTTNQTFNEAWERFKGLLRQCPHHGFSELHQLDTFYNSLNTNDQDALDSAAGGNFLDKMPRDSLAIIEGKSKVRYSRSRAIEPRPSTNAPLSTSTPSNSFEFQQLTASLEDKMDI